MSAYNPPSTPWNEQRTAGPYHLYDGSFVVEFLRPHSSRNCSVLMRCTYVASHPLCKLGQAHPQSPPLHLHFDQAESLHVLSGSVCTIEGYSVTPMVHTPQNTPAAIPPYRPHSFYPDPKATEDTTFLVWSHPKDTEQPMDGLFFANILRYVSDVHEKKVKMDLFQIMLMQHVTATAMVMFPSAWWLGSLRWRIPWALQAGMSHIARWRGYDPVMNAYSSKEDQKMLDTGKFD